MEVHRVNRFLTMISRWRSHDFPASWQGCEGKSQEYHLDIAHGTNLPPGAGSLWPPEEKQGDHSTHPRAGFWNKTSCASQIPSNVRVRSSNEAGAGEPVPKFKEW